MSGVYGPQLATWDDVEAANGANWEALTGSGPGSPEAARALDGALATHDGYRLGLDRPAAWETAPLEAAPEAPREPATAAEAWAALNREGPGADAVASYLAPGPQPRYDTAEARAEALADREAGS